MRSGGILRTADIGGWRRDRIGAVTSPRGLAYRRPTIAAASGGAPRQQQKRERDGARHLARNAACAAASRAIGTR